MIRFNLPNSKQSFQSLTTLIKTGFNPTLKHYNNFLNHLYKSKKYQFITYFILTQLIQENHITRSIFTKALLKQRNYEKAFNFINAHMPRPPQVLQNLVYDSLIQGFCVDLKNPERGFLVLQDLSKDDGFWPSGQTFSTLVCGFCKQGKMDKAIEVLEVMTSDKFRYPFDSFVVSCVVYGFISIRKYDLALRFYENAVKNDDRLRIDIVSYTCVLSAYCRLGQFEKVSDLVNKIERDGLEFDAVFYSSLVYEYFRAGIAIEGLKKHKEMVERKIERDTISYTILIDGFSKVGLVEKSTGFLYKMRKEGITPNLITYTAIILGFCKIGKVEEALNVFKIVENLGMELDEFVYATLIDGFCRIKDFDTVFHLLDEMKEKGIQASVITYNIIINGLCKSGRTDEAYEFSRGMESDAVTYTTMLHGYIKDKDLTGLLMTKKRLEKSGIPMDVALCNVVIKALFLAGLFEDVKVTYKRMSEMGLAANDVTFCTLIDGYCKFGRIEEALEIFDEFRLTSIDSVDCYSCIINGLCKYDMIHMGIQVFLELNERGMPLDPATYQLLLKSILGAAGPGGILDFVSKFEKLAPEVFYIICHDALCFLCVGGFFESASELYIFMRINGLVNTKMSYKSLLELLLKDKNTCLTKIPLSDFVKEIGVFEPRVSRIILHHLCMKDVSLAIKLLNTDNAKIRNLTFPVSVLAKLIKNGRAHDAYKLLMGSKERLPLMDVVDYTIIVNGLCKEGYIGKALEICALAKSFGIILNIITYNSIINGLCHQGCFIEAFRLFNSLETIKVTPSEITYSILIDSLSKEGYLVDAKKLLERMDLKGLKPNIRVYNSLMNGYSKLGRLAEVLSVIVNLNEKGIKPDEFTISVVINSFCRNGNMEGALEYYFDSRNNGFLPDLLGFFNLIRGLCSKGRMEESRSILRDMLQTEKAVDLLKKVDTGGEAESVDHFLISLCDQGNIREAILILDQIMPIFFPIGKKFDEGKCCNVGSQPLISVDQDDAVNGDFDAYYGMLASLCSSGELKKANKVAKLLAGFDGG